MIQTLTPSAALLLAAFLCVGCAATESAADGTASRAVVVPAMSAAAASCIKATVLLVRHADRQGEDLSPVGLARAQELVHVAGSASVRGIYHTEVHRTQQTAAPLAQHLSLVPVVFPAAQVAPLVQHIFANHRGETVLVVGHSNTVPLILKALGGPALPDIASTEYDKLFVVQALEDGTAKVLTLEYGAATP